jgi:two-component system, NtrC family, response regulator AtoC
MTIDILMVEDDDLYGESLRRALDDDDFRIDRVRSLRDARDRLATRRYELVLLDMTLPDGCGSDLLGELGARGSSARVLCLTARCDVPIVVQAMRSGARDYLLKSDSPAEVLARIRTHARELELLRAAGHEPLLERELVGSGAQMEAVRRLAGVAAQTSTTVLLSGETGTGKSHIARLIHRCSSRRDRPFVTVDCAALSETLAESELFGHERGSFTGAVARHIGAIESASDGTLFFDEIADLPPSAQGKLLRVLDERVVRRVGGVQENPVRARIVGATRRNLGDLVLEGRFREDLYFRLTVLEIPLPPLRERPHDVAPLLCRLLAAQGLTLRDEWQPLVASLQRHSFPGNVRELRNIAERMVLLSREGLGFTTLEDLGVHPALPVASVLPGPRSVAAAHREADEAIGRALVASQGRIGEAARTLGMSRHALRRRLKKLGEQLEQGPNLASLEAG